MLIFKIIFDWESSAPEAKEYANVTGVLKKGKEESKPVFDTQTIYFGTDPHLNDYEIKLP